MTALASLRAALGVCGFVAILSCAHAATTTSNWDRDYYTPTPDRERVLTMIHYHHFGLGKRRMRDGEFWSALVEFEFILTYYPNDPIALMAIVELCTKWKSPQCRAEDKFTRAIERNPTAADTYVIHGIYLHRNGKLREALEAYERAVELDPNSMNGHYNLALAYLDVKDYQAANEHAQLSYSLGASLPGLREKLKRLGHWSPGPAAGAATKAAPAATGPAPNAGTN